MSPPPYVDISITPAPVRAEPSVWDLVDWFDEPETRPGGWNAVAVEVLEAEMAAST